MKPRELIHEPEFALIARLGVRRFKRVSESYAEDELVAFAEAELIHDLADFRIGTDALGAVEKAHRTAKADGTDTHGPCGKNHILRQHSAVQKGEVIACICGDECHHRCVAETVAGHRDVRVGC